MPGRPKMVLHDLRLFRDLMAGRHDTVTLAKQVSRSKTLIAYLKAGTRRSCGADTAAAIEDALEVARGTLFREFLSADTDTITGYAMSKDLYKPREVGDRLGCSERHVRRLMAAGELPVVDIASPGSRYSKSRIPAAGLDAYIARNTAPSRAPRSAQPAIP